MRSWWQTETCVSEGSRLNETHAVLLEIAHLALLIPVGSAWELLSGQRDNPDDRWQQSRGRAHSALLTLSATMTAEHISQEAGMYVNDEVDGRREGGGCKQVARQGNWWQKR